MSILSFIKENRVLAAGLVLPLILVGLLAVAKTLPERMIDPPKAKLVYFSRNWSPKGQINLSVNEQGKFVAKFDANKDYKPNNSDIAPKDLVYLFDPQKNIVTEYPIELNDKNEPVVPEVLQSISLSNQQPSADGYTFEAYHYRSHSLLTEMFAYHSYDSGNGVITKNSRVIPLPYPKTYLGGFEFLGWEKQQASETK